MNFFGALPCGGREGELDDISRLHVVEIARLAWHVSFQPLQQEKTCNSAHEQTPLSNDTVNSVLWHRGSGRAKALSTPPRKPYHIHCRPGASYVSYPVTNPSPATQVFSPTTSSSTAGSEDVIPSDLMRLEVCKLKFTYEKYFVSYIFRFSFPNLRYHMKNSLLSTIQSFFFYLSAFNQCINNSLILFSYNLTLCLEIWKIYRRRMYE